uniref:Large ribosomal subunit protein uL23c n=1 Tax=Monodopsis sp. MarTras21 TaxID=1745953 RepID=A0A1D8RDB8_9STRA|nr:ribosomal protein L23 [Monodopsis sp. MarTras21]
MSDKNLTPNETIKFQKTQEAEWIDLLRYPLATEKVSNPFLKNTYTFVVHPKASKKTIKQAFEYVFKVKVLSINTLMMPKKSRRRRQFEGYLPTYKKAILKLAPEYSLDFFGMEKTSLGI